ncbi:MAG: protein kinase [Pseudomonadota bacterium]
MLCAACGEQVSFVEPCPRCGQPGLLVQRFELVEILGHGAVGTTYHARRLSDGQAVAVKEMMVRRVLAAKSLELFEREAQVLASLQHPGIPALYESLQAGEGRHLALYLVQEIVDGETLAEELLRRRCSEADVIAVMRGVLEILAYLADRRPPVVHRDIKPANIMRRRDDGRLVLIDFGCVRAALDTPEGGSTVAGTFGYMAPEQLLGRALPASDVYGLAATAVHLLSGEDPQRLMDLEHRIALDQIPVLSPALREVLQWMLAPEPADRPSDPRALAEHLGRILHGEEHALTSVPSRALGLLPPPPRALPERFSHVHAAADRVKMQFGFILLGSGGAAGLLGIAATLASPSLPLLDVLLPAGGLLLALGGSGAAVLARAWQRLIRLRRIYTNGAAVDGRIVECTRSSYTVNGARAWCYHYRYTVRGQEYAGSTDSWIALEVSSGDRVLVLHDPLRPERSLLHIDAARRRS